jgi:hypothetical protein
MDDLLDRIGQDAAFDDKGNVVSKEEASEKEEETRQETTEKTEEQSQTTAQDEKQEEAEVDEKSEEAKVDSPEFSFDSFKSYAKTKYEKEIDTEDALKDYFEKAEKYETLKKEVSDLEQRKTELEVLASQGLNGRDWFASDDEFIRQQFLKNSEGKFSESALGVLSNLSPEKVKKMDSIDAIKAQMMVDYPDMEKHEVEELVMSELGVDDMNREEWDSLPKAKMKKMATEAKKNLSKMYEGIEVPKAVDFQSSREGLKESWNDPLKAVVDGITSLELSEDLKFDLTSEMKNGLETELMNELLISQTKPTEEALAAVAGRMRSKILERNFDSVLKVVRDTIREEEKAALEKKVHNTSDLNESTRSESTTTNEALSGRDLLNAF